MNRDFRLFLTAEPMEGFPITLIQACVKVTMEPPRGLKAGLQRTFSTTIDQRTLERVDTPQWRQLCFALAFFHSVVQERRKYGPLGWSVHYDFNASDLSACIAFLERHMFLYNTVSWETLQYMVSKETLCSR